MKKEIMIMLLAAISCFGASAQNQKDSKSVNEMIEQRANAMAKTLKLDGTKTAAFIDLYKDYHSAADSLRKANMPKAKDKKNMTEQEAQAMLDDIFSQDLYKLQLKKAFCEKLRREGLTSVQLVKVMQSLNMGGAGMERSQQRRSGDTRNQQRPDGFPGGGFPGGGFPGGGF